MRKRVKRIALYGGLAFVLLLIVGVVLVRVMLTGPRVKRLIERSLEKRLNREVSIEQVELELLEWLKITGLTVHGRDGFTDEPLLTVKEVDIEADVRSLIKSGFGNLTASVTVKEPAASLECRADGALNIDDLLGAEGNGSAARKPGKSAAAYVLLGPVEMLNLNISVENGSVRFTDRANKTGTTIRQLGVVIDVTGLDVPLLKGSFSYVLSAAVGAPDKPGAVEAKGKVDFDLQERDGFLGVGVAELSGTLIDLGVEGLNPSLLARLLGLPPPADNLSLAFHAEVLPGEQVVISGDVDIPQLDAVSLGLNDRAVPGLGLKASIEGKADLAGGNAELKIEGACPLWKQLSLNLKTSELAAFALASGGSLDSAGSVKLDVRASADVGALTDGEVGRLLGAKDRVEGMLNLNVQAEGPVSNLAVKAGVGLEDLVVPKSYTGGVQLPAENFVLSSDGSMNFDPVTLALLKTAFSADFESAAAKGSILNGRYSRDNSGAVAAGGELEFSADFKTVLARYRKILPELPALDERVSVRASAHGGGGPVAIHGELESRRVTGPPAPVKIVFDGKAEYAGEGWDLRDIVLDAGTAESQDLKARVTGSVEGIFSDARELDIKFDQKINVSGLWDRFVPFLDLYGGKGVGGLKVAGLVTLTGGEFKSGPSWLSLKGQISLGNVVVEYADFPYMRLGVNGGVAFDNHSVQISNLAVALVNKKTKQETNLVIQKGEITSGIEGAELLADTSKIAASFTVTSPDVRVDRIVAAMEAKPSAKKPSAPRNKESVKSGKPAVPETSFEFLAGYRLDAEIKAEKAGYDTCVLTDLAGTVSLHNNIFKISGLKAGAYGGEVTGDVSADLNRHNPTHQGKLVVKRINLNDACSRMWSYKDVFHGVAEGQITWSASGLSPQTLKALKGGAGFRIENPMVRNIDRFPVLRGAAIRLGDIFFPGLLKRIRTSEFKFEPIQLNATLRMDKGRPVFEAKRMNLKTLDKDYLAVGSVGGLHLSPNARGEYGLIQPTRIYFMRFPEGWLGHLRLMEMLPKNVRGNVTDEDLRKRIRKLTAKGKVYTKIKGSVRNPKVGKMDFLDKMVEEFVKLRTKELANELLENLIKGGSKKKKDNLDAGDLIKGIFDALK